MTAHDESPEVPPVGEEIHLPSSSGLPIVNAAGLALMIVSITLTVVLVIVGAVIFVVSGLLWIREARREYDELPLGH